MNKRVRTSRTPLRLLWNCQYPYSDWLELAPDLRYSHMTQVTLSVIGLLLYWPEAVFIGHCETQHHFDPATEAVVCHSWHPWPEPGGV